MKTDKLIWLIGMGIIAAMFITLGVAIAITPGAFDTNINEKTAELISCSLLDYTKESPDTIKWEYDFGRMDTTYTTNLAGENVRVDEGSIYIYILK